LEYSESKADPFDGVADLERVVNDARHPNSVSHMPPPQRREPIMPSRAPQVVEFIDTILFAMDGTIQLLSREDVAKRRSSFVDKLVRDLSAKHSLRAAKLRWPDERVQRVKRELELPKHPLSQELLEFLSAFLAAGIAVADKLQKAITESGWDRYGYGVLLVWDGQRMALVDEGLDAHPAVGMRVVDRMRRGALVAGVFDS
jgi:hypothetical protein